MIEVNNVSKSYHNVRALNRVSLTIEPGQVLGVLGPNGAGKTTLFKLIAGFLNPDHGYIRAIHGRWPRIGYKPERLLYPPQIRVMELLLLSSQLSGMSYAHGEADPNRLLSRVNLFHAARMRVSECSKGMRQRLGLAQALLGDPQILLLDEPSNGLDPEGQVEIQQIIQELRQDGKTIVISTHQLQEVTEVCTDLIIIKQGEIHYRNTMQSALAERPHATIWLNRSAEPLRRLLASIHADIDIEGQTITLNREALFWRRQVIRLLLNYDYDILGMSQKRITLSEIYGNVIRS